MPKTAKDSATPRVPKYSRHCAGGRDRAFCYVTDERGARRRVYLGEWNTPASKRRFREVVAAHMLRDDPAAALEAEPVDADGITIVELVARFLASKEREVSASQWSLLVYSLRALSNLYGDELAASFGPVKLRRLREHLEAGPTAAPDAEEQAEGKKRKKRRPLCRKEINRRTRRVVSLFRWAASEELVSPVVAQALATLPPLRRGRTAAPESKPITPVPEDALKAAREHMTPMVRSMVDLQLATGMRGGEVVAMRRCDIDRSGGGSTWIYTPSDHKNAWREHMRRVPLGPRAQALLEPYLDGDPEGFVFSPKRSEDERRFLRRQQRQSPLTPSQRERDQQRRDNPRRKLLDAWTTETYRGAIHAACRRAGVPAWSPHQLRHSFEVLVERRFGVEAAAKALGHAEIGTTQHYRDKADLSVAVEIAMAIG
jgi:integrase